MKTEKRVYLVELNEYPSMDFDSVSDKEFMHIAEKQGNVYSLEGFQRDWNCGNVILDSFIRFIDVPVEEYAVVKRNELVKKLALNAMLDEMEVSIDEAVVSVVDGIRVFTKEAQESLDRWEYYFNYTIDLFKK